MITNEDYTDSILTINRSGIVGAPKSFRPIRPAAPMVPPPATSKLIKATETNTSTSTSPVNTSGTGGVPKVLLSISAAQSPIKQQTYTDSEVTVNFTYDPSDTNFDHVNIWVSGYHGNANSVLVASGKTSPIDFILDSTGEAVVVYGQTVSPSGKTADISFALSAAVTLSGVVTAPPAPTISQSLTATPLGYQFSFNQVNLGSTADVIDSYRVYRNTTNSFSGSTLQRTFRHDPTHLGAIVFQDNVGANKTDYYWVTSVNTIGLESSATAAQSGAVTSSPVSSGNNAALNTSALFYTVSNPLSQDGTTTNILVASSTFQFGFGTVVYNSGSVDPGAYGNHYVYADDPTYAGGAVTYLATNSLPVLTAADGRITFGKILTVAGGGGAGTGSGGYSPVL